jgi:tRNA (guanine-N7-)-methyltransferase
VSTDVKPPPDRLYGRARGHKLRHRQERLLELALPRLAFPLAGARDPARAFGTNMREIWLEVGFGGGEHAAAQAAAHPDVGQIACEVFENGVCSLLSRLIPDGDEATSVVPDNLRLFTDDARILLRSLPDGVLSKLFLLFPDPWPKARHAKRRFVHPEQLALIARVLCPGGEWRVASDDPTYQAWVTEVMAAQDFFTAPPPASVRPLGWPPTRYEAKALREGRAPLYWSFIRRP